MPDYALATIGFLPLRKQPNHESGMLSQVLFGETVEILDLQQHWAKVYNPVDQTTGWTEHWELMPLSEKAATQARQNIHLTADAWQGLHTDKHFIPVPLGAVLPSFDGIMAQSGTKKWLWKGQVHNVPQCLPDRRLIHRLLSRYLNAPFLYGGRTPMGIDGMGLLTQLFRFLGIPMYRNQPEQPWMGPADQVDFIALAQPGDIAIMARPRSKEIHWGILSSANTVVHVLGSVREDVIDQVGIPSAGGEYLLHLKSIHRVLPPMPIQAAEQEHDPVVHVVPNQIVFDF